MDRAYIIFALFFLLGIPAQAVEGEQESPIPAWIWSNANPAENERVFFRREFQLPPDIASASIIIACDDWQRITFNGQEIGEVSQWNEARSYDVLAKLNPDGKNIINVEARNDRGPAGLALHFTAMLKDGKILHLISDAQWSCNPEAPDGWLAIDYDGSQWPRALVIAKMGDAPWGNIMQGEEFVKTEKPLDTGIAPQVAQAPVPPCVVREASPEVPAAPSVEQESSK